MRDFNIWVYDPQFSDGFRSERRSLVAPSKRRFDAGSVDAGMSVTILGNKRVSCTLLHPPLSDRQLR